MSSLTGRHFLLTRTEEDNALWRATIESRGGRALSWPCLVCQALPEGLAHLPEAVRGIDWIALSSRRSATLLSDQVSAEAVATKRLACVGPGTAQRTRELFGRVDLVASGGTARSLAGELLAATDETTGVLWLGAESPRPDFAAAFAAADRRLRELALYRTIPAHSPRPQALPAVDAIFFASPSAVRGFLRTASAPSDTPLISIGPSTSTALREAGLEVASEAQTRDLEGMLAATLRLAQKP